MMLIRLVCTFVFHMQATMTRFLSQIPIYLKLKGLFCISQELTKFQLRHKVAISPTFTIHATMAPNYVQLFGHTSTQK